jgi:hypothetical protein
MINERLRGERIYERGGRREERGVTRKLSGGNERGKR